MTSRSFRPTKDATSRFYARSAALPSEARHFNEVLRLQCHSRESGNPEPPNVRPSLDPRFRGDDTGTRSSLTNPAIIDSHLTSASPREDKKMIEPAPLR